MVWTAVGVAGMVCVVAGVCLAFGVAAGLSVLGVMLIAAAVDGRRP